MNKMTWADFLHAALELEAWWEERKDNREHRPKILEELEAKTRQLFYAYLRGSENEVDRQLRKKKMEIAHFYHTGAAMPYHFVGRMKDLQKKEISEAESFTIEKLEEEDRQKRQKQRDHLAAEYRHHGILKGIIRKIAKNKNEFVILHIDDTDYVLFDLDNLRQVIGEDKREVREGDEIFFSLRQTEQGRHIDRMVALPSEGAPQSRKLERALQHPGMTTERSLNYLMSTPCETAPCGLVGLTTREKWIVDCIVESIANDPLFREDPDLYRFSHSQMVQIVNSSETIEDVSLWFSFADDDIRRLTGRKDLPGWKIEQLLEGVRKKGEISGTFKVFYDQKHWCELKVSGYLISDLLRQVYGKASYRKNVPEKHAVKKQYRFRLGSIAGLWILSNLAKGQFEKFPQGFYRLRPRAQDVARYLSLHVREPEGARVGYELLSKLEGLKEDTVHPDQRIKQFKDDLDSISHAMGFEYKHLKGHGKSITFVVRRKRSTPLKQPLA
jgi:hypothetical protein